MYRACSTNAEQEEKNVYRLLIVKPEGRRLLGRSRCRWMDIMKINLREI
jgi:hypothetical protein